MWDKYVPIAVHETRAAHSGWLQLLDLADLPSGAWAHIRSDGGDLRFYLANGTTRLPAFIVPGTFVHGTGGKVWVYVGTTSTSVETDIRCYFGNIAAVTPAVTDTYGRNNVFATVNGWVHHYGLDEASASGNAVDSTGANDATRVSSPGVVSGIVGGGRDFDGSADYFTLADNSAVRWGDNLIYFRGLIKFDSLSGTRVFYDKYNTTGNNRSYRLAWNVTGSDSRISLTASANGSSFSDVRSDLYVSSVGAITTGVWYMVQGYHDPTANQSRIALDGYWNSSSHNSGFFDQTQPFRMGASSTASFFTDGQMDEWAMLKGVSISYVDWAADEMDMIFDPSSMATFGAMEDNEEPSGFPAYWAIQRSGMIGAGVN